MKLKRLTAFLFICMCFNSGCVYESMTSRLYRGEYIDIEPERKFNGTVKEIRAIDAKDKIILKFSYQVEKSENKKSTKYDEFYDNNCLALYIEPRVENTINLNENKNIECKLKKLRSSYYNDIVFFISNRQKKDDTFVGMYVETYYNFNSYCNEVEIKTLIKKILLTK